MIRAFLLAFLIAGTQTAFAQERATTESGRVVLLHTDGTWRFADTATGSRDSHVRPPEATAKIELARGRASLFYNPSKWRLGQGDEPGTNSLTHITGDGYGLVIAERIEMTLDALRDLALSNARSVAPDAAITWREGRVVNGQEILALQIRGTIQGISFVYLGYYYVGAQGTFQILTYTSSNLFEEYRADFEELLDGFVLAP